MPIPCKYTVFTDSFNADTATVLYFLHGSGGNEMSWKNLHNEFVQYWQEKNKPVPVVVGVSFRKRWILVPENKSKKSGYLGYFLDTIMPEIEKQLKQPVKKRYLFGISMGGYNAAQLFFRNPGMFEKAAICSPAIYPFSLYAPEKEIRMFIDAVRSEASGLRHRIKYTLLGKDIFRENIYRIIKGHRTYIPDQSAWEKSHIFFNMKKPLNSEKSEVYISCGKSDEYGLFPGAQMLAEKARSLSYTVEWHPLKGGHPVLDKKAIAEFFIRN